MLEYRFLKSALIVVLAFSTLFSTLMCMPTAAEDGQQQPDKQQPNKPNTPRVTLQVAVSLGAPSTTFVFSVTNNGEEDLVTVPIATNQNRIVIVKPGGAQVEIHNLGLLIEPVIIKPKQSLVQNIVASQFFAPGTFDEVGLYRLGMKLRVDDKEKPGETIEYRSNEVLLIKEIKG